MSILRISRAQPKFPRPISGARRPISRSESARRQSCHFFHSSVAHRGAPSSICRHALVVCRVDSVRRLCARAKLCRTPSVLSPRRFRGDSNSPTVSVCLDPPDQSQAHRAAGTGMRRAQILRADRLLAGPAKTADWRQIVLRACARAYIYGAGALDSQTRRDEAKRNAND